MAGEFIIKQTVPNTFTVRARHFQTINVDSNAPVSPLPLPEQDAEQAILVKIEGNSEVINLGFYLEDSALAMVDEVSATKTAIEKMIFLLSSFQATTINHKYQFTIDGTLFTRNGTIT